MRYSKGDRVRYLGKPEWGPGLVLGDCGTGKTRVFFAEAGVKILVLRYARLMKVKVPPSRDPPLTTGPSATIR